MPDAGLYGGQDPRKMSAYSIPEAVHYLQIPRSTLRDWVKGRAYPTGPGRRFSPPLIPLLPAFHQHSALSRAGTDLRCRELPGRSCRVVGRADCLQEAPRYRCLNGKVDVLGDFPLWHPVWRERTNHHTHHMPTHIE